MSKNVRMTKAGKVDRRLRPNKAPLAEEDDFGDDDGFEAAVLTQTKNKKQPKKNNIVVESSVEDETQDEELEKPEKAKKSQKLTKKDTMVDMVSYKFLIQDQDHPFYALNNKIGSIDITEIRGEFDRDNVSLLTYIFS